jgi:hypothetical protein
LIFTHAGCRPAHKVEMLEAVFTEQLCVNRPFVQPGLPQGSITG